MKSHTNTSSNSYKDESILVFGGAFSPPTLSHQRIIEQALKLPNFAEVWVMPSRDRLDKVVSAGQNIRLHMLQTMVETEFANDTRLKVTDFELCLPAPSSTLKTHDALTKAHPNKNFTYLVGEDSVASMPTWVNSERLMNELEFVIVPRSGAKIINYPKKYAYLEDFKEEKELSSTDVRTAIQLGADFESMVANSVAQIINENNLYKEG